MRVIIMTLIIFAATITQSNLCISAAELLSFDSALVLLQKPASHLRETGISNLLKTIAINGISNNDKNRLVPVLHSIFDDLPLDYKNTMSIRTRFIRLLTAIKDSTCGDILISIYEETKRSIEKDSLSEIERSAVSSACYQSLIGLAEIGDSRAESLALESINSKNWDIVDAAVSVFAILKTVRGITPLLNLLESGKLRKEPTGEYVFLSGCRTSEGKVMWTLTQIGKAVTPYLANAISEPNERFRQLVALLICRIGTDDSLLKQQTGEILTNMIEAKQDSFHLEEAVRCIGNLGYRKGLPALFSILLDETIIDKPMLSTADFPFIPNRTAINALKQFGLSANLYYITESKKKYEVIEFTDLAGKHHKVMKLLTEKQGCRPK